ncbi:MAG: HNH endonuclease [Trichocoleus desertorum ATA4-8-CV12]|jgi:hypothetical protein|nr:HNH endonuclease [Trichocoleus desertorum ATA4-8-CV12]
MSTKLEACGLSATTLRSTPSKMLVKHHALSTEEVTWLKQCVSRQPINQETVQKLLESSNFVCCCCKGIKSDAYIIHHIVEYEISQDNSYSNLVVLCPNDHDLAHRSPGLTSKLTIEQIKSSKESWEQQVRLHNLAMSESTEREDFILKIPRYQELQEQIKVLKDRITDKEKLLTRSEAFFDIEISKLQNRILELENQKTFLEQQVESILQKLNDIDLSTASELYPKAVFCFLNAEIDKAIDILNEVELDAELARIQERENILNDSMRKNADSRFLKAKLLTLNLQFSEAEEVLVKGLEIYGRLAEREPESYLLNLVLKIEEVGSIYCNLGQAEIAEIYFFNALSVCEKLEELQIYKHLPFIPIIFQNIGACYYYRGDHQQSQEYLELANSLFGVIDELDAKLQEENPEHSNSKILGIPFLKYRHALVLNNLGTTYSALEMNRKAQISFLNAKNIYEELVLGNESFYLEGLVKNLAALGYFYLANNDLNAAEKTYLDLLPHARKLAEKKYKAYLEDLADILLNFTAVCIKLQKFEEAKFFCDEAINLYRQLASTRGEHIEMQLVSALMYYCISLVETKGSSNEILNYAREVKILCDQYPDNIDAQEQGKTSQVLIKMVEKA